MAKQERELSAEPLPDGRTLVTRVYYMKLNGARRGYYLEVKPVERKTDAYGTTESFMLLAGVSEQVASAAKFSAKELATLVVAPEKLAEVKAKALAKIAAEDAR